jgi:hypothetical protein
MDNFMWTALKQSQRAFKKEAEALFSADLEPLVEEGSSRSNYFDTFDSDSNNQTYNKSGSPVSQGNTLSGFIKRKK